MMRISEAQAWLLGPIGKAKGPRMRKPPAELPENRLEAQIRMYLGAQGWTVIRRHVGTFVPYHFAIRHIFSHIIRIGERGEADWLCSRPAGRPGLVEQFALETKAPSAKPSRDQELWMARQRAGGFIAVWFDNFDRFEEWYRETWK